MRIRNRILACSTGYRLLFGLLILLLLAPAAGQAQCINTVNFTFQPSPNNGGYANGDTVDVCIEVVNYTQSGANWFHGVVLNLGPGWEPNIFDPIPANSCDGQGNWGFYNSVTSLFNGVFGQGFYYESPAGPGGVLNGDPGDNYGDNCTNNTWTFCFTLVVDQNAPPGTSLDIVAEITPDGETGGWTNTDCNNDQQSPVFLPLVTSCQEPTLSTSITEPACPGDTNGEIDITATGITPPWEYSLDSLNWQSTGVFSNLAGGPYTVYMRDDSGCVFTFDTTLNAPLPIDIAPSVTNPLCADSASGSASVTVTGGTSPYNYSWNTTPPQSGPSASDLEDGSYTVVVTDANGCQDSLPLVLNDPPPLSLSLSAVNASCGGSTDGSATVTASGGTPNYTYSWNTSPPQTTTTASNLSTGTYTVTVTDDNGCVAEDSIEVVANDAVFVSASGTDPLCPGSSDGTLSASGSAGTPPFTFTWNTTPPTNAPNVNNVPAGTYTVTITDQNGCTDDTTLTLTDPPGIDLLAAGTDPLCAGASDGTAYVTTAAGGTPPYTFEWNTSPVQTGDTAVGLAAGSYTVTLTDANNCTATASVTLTDPPTLTVNIVSTDSTTCFGLSDGEATVEGNGGTQPYTYSWATSPIQTTQTATGLSAGPVNVTVTDANGCTAATTATVEEPNQLVLGQTTTPNNCFGDSAGTATVSISSGGVAPFSYVWSTTPPQTTATATGLPAGTYTAVVTDANGCQDSISATVTEPAPISVGFNATEPNCSNSSDGTLTALPGNGTAPYTFSWATTPPQAGPTATNLVAGDYAVTVTDAIGCSITDTGTVTAPPALTIAASGTNPECGGINDGAVFATASGGTPLINNGAPVYFYEWNTAPPVGFQQLINLGPGEYVVTATDGNGCQATDTVTLTAPPPLVIDSVVIEPVLCHSGNSGELGVQYSGGSAPYAVSWNSSPPQSGDFATNLPAGNYTATLTDANGCSTDTTVNLPQPPPIQVAFTKTDVVCFGEDGGSATLANISGGTPASGGYDIEWSTTPPVTGQSNISNLLAGDYSVTVTDSLGCSFVRDFTILQPPQLNLALSVDSATCANGDDGQITAFASGGVPPYSYSWSTGSTEQGIDSLLPGNYGVLVTDANGCPDTADATVFAPDPLQANVQVEDASCAGVADGSAEVFPQGGSPPYNFVWVGYPEQQYTKVATGLRQDSMYVKVFDNSGCRIDVPFYVDAPNRVEVDIDAPTDRTCPGEVITFTAAASGGQPAYSYQWSSRPAGYSATGAIAVFNAPEDSTWYVVRATDQNGCAGTDSAQASVHPGATAEFELTPVEACDSATVSLNNTSRDAVEFFWDFGDGATSAHPEPSHTYTQEGSYSIELLATSRHGCTDTMFMPDVATIYRTAVAAFTANPPRDEELQLLNATISFTSQSTDATSYAWSFGDGSTSTQENPTHTYDAPGEYWVELTVSNELGCGDSLRYGPYRIALPEIQVPNVFTPNNDGVNDFFRISNKGIANGRLWIFDRWGREMFAGNVLEWDGTGPDGEPAQEGVYFFKLEATAIDGKEFTDDGQVTLLR